MSLADKDGVTHINVYSNGKTKLGRFLSNFAHTPFTHPEDGKFSSVEGYWYWLSCKDDKLRTMSGWEAKYYGRKVGGEDWLEDEEFKRKIKLAIDVKLKLYPEACLELAKCTLPLVHYYCFGDKIIAPVKGLWVIDHLESYKSAGE